MKRIIVIFFLFCILKCVIADAQSSQKSKKHNQFDDFISVKCRVKNVMGGLRALLSVEFPKDMKSLGIFKEKDGSAIKFVMSREEVGSLSWVRDVVDCDKFLTVETFRGQSEETLFISILENLEIFSLGSDKGMRKIRVLMGNDPVLAFNASSQKASRVTTEASTKHYDGGKKRSILENSYHLVIDAIDKAESLFNDSNIKKTSYGASLRPGAKKHDAGVVLPKAKKLCLPVRKPKTLISVDAIRNTNNSVMNACNNVGVLPTRNPFMVKNLVAENRHRNNFDIKAIGFVILKKPDRLLDFTPNYEKEGSVQFYDHDSAVEMGSTNIPERIKDGYLAVRNIVSSTADHIAEEPAFIDMKKKVKHVARFVAGDKTRMNHGSNKVIVIDPGHGGKDSGSVSKRGVKEKDIAMLFSDILKRKLIDKGFKVIMTRKGDYYIMSHRRVMQARVHKPAFMISVHADGSINTGARGASAYTVSDESADIQIEKIVQQKKPMYWGDGFHRYGDLVGSVIVGLMQYSSKKKSRIFVEDLLERLSANGVRVRMRQPQAADFAVLKGVDVPSVLIELGFLTNQHDEMLMLNKQYLDKFADTVVVTLLDNIVE